MLYTASPAPVTRRLAPVPLLPCPPEIRRPPLIVLAAVVDTLATLRALLVVSAACFPEMVVLMSTPARYSGPARIMLDPMIADPPTSMEGALTGQENTAVLASPRPQGLTSRRPQ